MRIVGGEFRGRPLAGPSVGGTRPTSDRARETIFDILAHRFGNPVAGARVLDLFAGTGALGLEALSRGAASCLMVEQSAEARGTIRRNVEALGLTGRARIFRRDATKLGEIGTLAPFGLFFADPPYRRDLAEAALAAAAKGGWLTPDAVGVIEEAADIDVVLPPGFTVLHQRSIGDTQLLFLRWEESE
jgi:16S rRNA (guanine966-N2)-methyltransferase